MSSSLQSLVASGTKLWLDSIDPTAMTAAIKEGATGATSNPIIVADILQNGDYEADIKALKKKGLDAEAIAWQLTDKLVDDAEGMLYDTDIFGDTGGDDGFVSFELDPLLEDGRCTLSRQDKIKRYTELAIEWGEDRPQRLIKVPATEEGIAALAPMVAAGINVNVTLIFSERQLEEARRQVWEGAQQREDLSTFKSVYSIFVSRLDAYADKQLPELSAEAKDLVGIYNAKKLWLSNKQFWQDKNAPLNQEIVFASTGTKRPDDEPWKYVAALAGSDIQTNPPATNAKTAASGLTFHAKIEEPVPAAIAEELEAKVDWRKMESVLMAEGLEKFSEPQKKLIDWIAEV